MARPVVVPVIELTRLTAVVRARPNNVLLLRSARGVVTATFHKRGPPLWGFAFTPPSRARG